MARLTLAEIGSRITPMARKWSKPRKTSPKPAAEKPKGDAPPAKKRARETAPIYKFSGRT